MLMQILRCSITSDMTAVVPPDNVLEAVAHLPACQDPYGAACTLSRAMECVFFHYRLRQAEALVRKGAFHLRYDVGRS